MDYKTINEKAWNNRTKVHLKSEFYDLAGFKAGKSSLNRIELKLLGDVSRQSILHLQCHFGQDSISLAKLGASVTGVDLSSEAIAQAKSLAQELQVDAEFICSDVYDFAENYQTRYDLVYTSYGVLCWLPDMNRWAQTIASSLKPNGRLVLVEFHPISDLLAGYSYLDQSEPDIEAEGTYTENCDGKLETVVTWPHPISEVITALINAGLAIEQFNEYPYSPYDCVGDAQKLDNGMYQVTHKDQLVPLIYSITARKL